MHITIRQCIPCPAARVPHLDISVATCNCKSSVHLHVDWEACLLQGTSAPPASALHLLAVEQRPSSGSYGRRCEPACMWVLDYNSSRCHHKTGRGQRLGCVREAMRAKAAPPCSVIAELVTLLSHKDNKASHLDSQSGLHNPTPLSVYMMHFIPTRNAIALHSSRSACSRPHSIQCQASHHFHPRKLSCGPVRDHIALSKGLSMHGIVVIVWLRGYACHTSSQVAEPPYLPIPCNPLTESSRFPASGRAQSCNGRGAHVLRRSAA